MSIEVLIVKWAVIATGVLMAVCLLAMLLIWPFSGQPARVYWGWFWREFRWGFSNAWHFQRDMICAPVVGVRLALRRDAHRRRLHRRQRSEERSDAVK